MIKELGLNQVRQFLTFPIHVWTSVEAQTSPFELQFVAHFTAAEAEADITNT